MVTGVIIPADESVAVTRHQFHGLSDYQQAVGGFIGAIDLESPAMSFFVNDESKLIGLPINRRATTLWWLHSPAAYGYDIITGDAVLVGQPDRVGETQSVPDEFVALLTGAQAFKVEVQTAGPNSPWCGNRRCFPNYFAAAQHAADLRFRWTQVTAARVVTA